MIYDRYYLNYLEKYWRIDIVSCIYRLNFNEGYFGNVNDFLFNYFLFFCMLVFCEFF